MSNIWQKTKIGEYFDVTNGKTNTDDAVIDGEYPLFDRSVLIKKSNKYLFDKEALIIPGEGKEFLPRYFSGKFDLHQRAYAIFSKGKSDVDIKFLFYWMNYRKDYLVQNAVGSTVKSLRLYMINNFPLLVPPLETQQKIALILSTIDEEIQETDQIIQKTEKLKNGLMLNFFSDKFEMVKLGDYVEIRSGDSPSSFSFTEYGEIPFYKVEDMNQSQKYLINTRYHFSLYKKPLMPKGMVVFPKRGEAIQKNKVRILLTDAYFDTNIMGLISKNGLVNEYLYYLLKYIGLSQFADTTSIPQINNKHINPLIIPLPNKTEQNKFVQMLINIDEKITMETIYKEKIISLKQGLMNDIFNQKVEVN